MVDKDDTTFNGCFGCGSANASGLKLEFKKDGDQVVAELEFRAEFAGYQEFVHGGIVATVLDEAQGWAMLTLAGRYGITRALTVTYRRPVTVGVPLIVRGRLSDMKDRNVYLRSQLEDGRGRVLAIAEGHWVVIRAHRADGSGG